MGGGYWRREDFARYSAGMGRKVSANGHIDTSAMRGAQDMYRARRMDPALDPYRVTRECCDSDEHPQTVPVILALDVTGSMGGALLKTAASLNVIMQNILAAYKDMEFMVMGIGDLAYDQAPIQISQFESDIRIAEHLDRIWFERGGGGNGFESYTAAWYMGLDHTRLDCHKRGRKGVIITLGDEPLNPYLPARRLARVTGDVVVRDVETRELYRRACQKFELFHIAIDDPGDCYARYAQAIDNSFGRLMGKRLKVSTLDQLPDMILKCLEEAGVGAQERLAGTQERSATAAAPGAAGSPGDTAAAAVPGAAGSPGDTAAAAVPGAAGLPGDTAAAAAPGAAGLPGDAGSLRENTGRTSWLGGLFSGPGGLTTIKW